MNINTYREYQKTFAEIDFILNNTDEKVRSRIPEEFKKLIKNNLDKEYEVNINLESGLESCTLLPKTKDVLSLIYRDYLCTKEEKEELNKIWKTKNKKINVNETLSEINDIKNQKINNEDKKLVKFEEEKWYMKIAKNIKMLFKL